MKASKLTIGYTEIPRNELTAEWKQLLERAIQAASKAYAPYSQFNVGSAILLSDQTMVTGSNQENAAFPSGLCAERVALFYAGHEHREKTITKMVVCAVKKGELLAEPVTPCGACRQVMVESILRQKSSFEILLWGNDFGYLLNHAELLLPFSFDAGSLK